MTVLPAGLSTTSAKDLSLSIVIDSYQQVQFLGRAIDSALAQGVDVQVVVVDDGSTDGSWELVRSYGDRLTAVLKANGGQGSALNAGWLAATGDLVAFLDADDELAPGYAQLAVRLFDDPSVTLGQLRMTVIDADGAPTGDVIPPAYVALARGDVAEDVRRWRVASALAPTSGLVFTRQVLERLMPLPAELLRHGADFPLARGAALLGQVRSSDTRLVRYRTHGANNSNAPGLNLPKLRTSMLRQVACVEWLSEVDPGVRPPLTSPDPVFTSQRLASLRTDPAGHPFPDDTRWSLLELGLRTAVIRNDVRLPARVVHAAWFLLVTALPRSWAARLVLPLIRPTSRGAMSARGLGLLRRRVVRP